MAADTFLPMRILFAEDDKELRTAVSRGLREASYSVDLAATGTQAQSLAAANDYDVVILDILLPGLDGLAVCSEIRLRGDRVPILLLTALDAVDQRIAGLDSGADDYLTKPFAFGELLARLRALTRRAGEAVTQPITVHDLVIDPSRHHVRRGDRDITLTAKEFAFLLQLARHAGHVVTRADLMEHVWDDSTTYSNIIDVYAGRLRRKIDDGERVALFSTLRGVGFILQAPEPARKTKRSTHRRPARRR